MLCDYLVSFDDVSFCLIRPKKNFLIKIRVVFKFITTMEKLK